MIEDRLTALLHEAVAASDLGLNPQEASFPAIELERPRQKAFGDFTTTLALVLAPRVERKPREVAEAIVAAFPATELVTSLEIAGPGFLNFRVHHGWMFEALTEIREQGERFGHLEPNGKSVQVEYVSANPVGPLHVGTARNAVLGDAVSNVLTAAGWRVEREYYFNDAGNQMDLFAASIEARYLQHFGQEVPFPQDGYAGSYITDIAAALAAEFGDRLVSAPAEERWATLKERGEAIVFAWIRATLDRMGIVFDGYFSERTLHEAGGVTDAVQRLLAADDAYESEGAIWFRATKYGDDKDRVLIKTGGAPTYFAADCAYVIDKFARGFDHLLYVWGADHHGTVQRFLGAAEALGYASGTVEVLLYQLVTLLRGGEPVKMSKRTGDIITLDELLDEVGPDATRFTLLTQSNDSVINFDIEEVARQTLDNPVYYVQYAHARIASILRRAASEGVPLAAIGEANLELLTHESELDLLRELADFPEQILVAANLRAPHRLTHFARVLAECFHRFYTECKVLTDDAELTQARLQLAAGTKQVIANVLTILGVSAPEHMERSTEPSDDT